MSLRVACMVGDCHRWAVPGAGRCKEHRPPEHRWTDRDGQTWVCDAYDHGPMCRQCRPVPSTDEDRLTKAAEVCKAAGYRVVKLEGPGNGSEWRDDYFTVEEEL